jgi:hypothetical protein
MKNNRSRAVPHIKAGLIVASLYIFIWICLMFILPKIFPDFQSCTRSVLIPFSCESAFTGYAFYISSPGYGITFIPVLNLIALPILLLLPLWGTDSSQFGWLGNMALVGFLPSVFFYFGIAFLSSVFINRIMKKPGKQIRQLI